MARFCTACGKEIAQGVAFCTECGTKAPADTAPQATETVTAAAPVHTPPSPKPPPSQQVYTPPVQPVAPVPSAVVPQAIDPANKVVGTGAYFGLMILFSLPIVGFIACIVMAFLPKNKNLKNYARAMLIWSIITLVVVGLLALLFSVLLNSVTNLINQSLGENFGGIGDVFSQLGAGSDPTGDSGISGGGLGGLGDLFSQFGELSQQMEQLENGGLGGLPSE